VDDQGRWCVHGFVHHVADGGGSSSVRLYAAGLVRTTWQTPGNGSTGTASAGRSPACRAGAVIMNGINLDDEVARKIDKNTRRQYERNAQGVPIRVSEG
jgi:hypothetical protein